MKKNMIDNWLDKYGDPEINQFVDKNLNIVDKVNSILKDRNLSKAEFAKMLGKKPSEVSRWLTGMHNLTLKSIIKMEVALGIDLIYTAPEVEYHYVNMGIIEGQKTEQENVPYEAGEEIEPLPIAG